MEERFLWFFLEAAAGEFCWAAGTLFYTGGGVLAGMLVEKMAGDRRGIVVDLKVLRSSEARQRRFQETAGRLTEFNERLKGR